MTKRGFLSNNAIKIIACFLMLADHSILMIIPSLSFFRNFTRFGFALFAFMLAEGCFYTKNKLKHFLLPTVFGLIMQIFLYIFTKMLDFSIFWIFTLSILLSYLFGDTVDSLKAGKHLRASVGFALFTVSTLLIYFFDQSFPYMRSNYGFFGVILPVLFYISIKILPKNIYICFDFSILIACTLLKCYAENSLFNLAQILACPVILCYNGTRGKWKLKYFFYIFYPLHFALLWLLAEWLHISL